MDSQAVKQDQPSVWVFAHGTRCDVGGRL